MELVSKMFDPKPVKVWPVGSKNLQFRRVTDRYAPKGTFSSNRVFCPLCVTVAMVVS